MKKVAKILYLVGGIYSIVAVAGMFIAAVIMLIFSGAGLTAAIIEGINDGSITSSFKGTPAEVAAQIQILFLIIGLILLFLSGLGVVNSILSFKARNSASKNLFIVNIVFAALSGIEINLVASIFALIAGNTLDDNQQPKQEDASKIDLRKPNEE